VALKHLIKAAAKAMKAARDWNATQDKGMAVTTYSEATAFGQDTHASTTADVTVKEKGKVTVARGKLESTAMAKSTDGDVFVSAYNDVDLSEADIIIVRTKTKLIEGDTGSFTKSVTKFKAIDVHGWDGPPLIIETNRNVKIDGIDFDLNKGNFATSKFNVKAFGEDTLAMAEVYTLGVEDQLSTSTLMSIAATG
jgi:hypothetical protein